MNLFWKAVLESVFYHEVVIVFSITEIDSVRQVTAFYGFNRLFGYLDPTSADTLNPVMPIRARTVK